jgi:hypothetical protein
MVIRRLTRRQRQRAGFRRPFAQRPGSYTWGSCLIGLVPAQDHPGGWGLRSRSHLPKDRIAKQHGYARTRLGRIGGSTETPFCRRKGIPLAHCCARRDCAREMLKRLTSAEKWARSRKPTLGGGWGLIPRQSNGPGLKSILLILPGNAAGRGSLCGCLVKFESAHIMYIPCRIHMHARVLKEGPLRMIMTAS